MIFCRVGRLIVIKESYSQWSKCVCVCKQCILACFGVPISATPWPSQDKPIVMKHGRNSFWMNSLLVNTHSLSPFLSPSPCLSLYLSPSLFPPLYYLSSGSWIIYDNDIIQSGKDTRWPAVKERNLWHKQYILQEALGRSCDDPTVALHPAANSCTTH